MKFTFNQIKSISAISRGNWQNVLSESKTVIPFLDYDWMRIWLKHFAEDKETSIYVVYNQEKEIVGIIPTIRMKEHNFGFNFNVISFAANSHSFRTSIIAKEDVQNEIFVAWWRFIQGKSRFDYLKFKEFLASNLLFAELDKQKISYSLEEKKQPPYIKISADWENYFSSLKGHFRRNLRRRLRNAQKDFGKVEYRILSDNDGDLQQWIKEGLELEASGWKGKMGSAILKSEKVKQFYFDIARAFQERGQLHVGGLFFDQHMVGFNFSLVYQGVFYLLKIAYDETVARYSPGQIMMYFLLQKTFNEKLRYFDFLGPSMPWKLEWTDKFHDHYTLILYAPTAKGRLAYLLNRKILPHLRKIPLLHKLKQKTGV
jgi:CelD/BcsL family acetyltransferase involved in cellulose biosynthesis